MAIQRTIGVVLYSWNLRRLAWLSVVMCAGLGLFSGGCSAPVTESCTSNSDCQPGWRCQAKLCVDCSVPGSCAQEKVSDGGVKEAVGLEVTEPAVEIMTEPSVESATEPGRDVAVEPSAEKPPGREPGIPEEPVASPEKPTDTQDAGGVEEIPEPTPELPKQPTPICTTPPALPKGPLPSHLLGQWQTQAYDYISGTTGPFMDMTSDGSMIAVGSFNSMAVQIWKWSQGEYRLVHTLWTGHTRWLRSLRFSRDGKYLATGGLDFAIRVWRTSDWKLLHLLEQHASTVFDLDFSPDGKSLASAGYYDYRIRLWDLSTGLQTKALYNRRVGSNSSSVVFAVAYSPDGKFVATGSNDDAVKLWNVATGKVMLTMKGHTDDVWSVKFSPDGKWIVSTSNDRTARIWNAKTGAQVAVLRNPNTTSDGYTYSAVFSKDSKLVMVSGGTDRRVYFWDIVQKKYVYQSNVFIHGSTVRTVRLHPNGKLAMSVGYDNLLRVWNLDEKPSQKSYHDIYVDLVYRMVPHPNGKYLWVSWSNDTDIQLWDTTRNQEVGRWQGHTAGVRALALSPNKQILASASIDRTIRLWDVSTGKVIRVIQNAHSLPINHLVFQPSGNWLASSGDDQVVKLWNTSNGKLIRTLSGHTGRVYEAAISPNGDELVSVGEDRKPRVWSLTNAQQQPKELSGHTDRVLTVTYDPKGQWLATSGWDRRVRMWKTSDYSLVREARTPLSIVRSLAFSADSKLLAAASNDRKIKVWDTTSGEMKQTFSGHLGPVTQVRFKSLQQLQTIGLDRSIRTWELEPTHKPQILQGHSDAVTAVSFHPNGTVLATGSTDKTIRLWSTDTWKTTATLKGHQGGVTCLAFHQAGTSLASGDDNKQIFLWDMKTGQGAALPDGHQAALVGVAFDPKGSWLISASTDGHIRMWDLTQKKLLREWKGPAGQAVSGMSLSRDGAVLATVHQDGYLRLWNTADGKLRKQEKRHSGSGWARSVDFDRKQYLFVTGGDDNSLRVYSARSYNYSRGLYGSPGDVLQVAFGPAGENIAGAVSNHAILLWLWRDSHNTHILQGHTDRVHGLSFHPNGRWLVSASADKTVRLWPLHYKQLVQTQYIQPFSGTLGLAYDATLNLFAASGDNTYIRLHEAVTGILNRNMYSHAGRVRALAYHPKKNILISGSDDRTIRIIEASTSGYSNLRSVSVHASAVTDLLITDGGNILVTGSLDQTAKVWKLDPNNAPPTLLDILAHGGAIRQLRSSSDGKLLLTWASDHTVRLWDLQAGQLRRTYRVNGDIAGIALRPDGKQLAIMTTDGTLRIWLTSEDAEESNLTKKWPGKPVYLRYDPKSQWLAVAFTHKKLMLLEANCYRKLREYDLRFGEAQVMTWTPDSTGLFIGDHNGGVTLWWCPDCKP